MYNFEYLLTVKNNIRLPPFTGHLLRAAVLKLISNNFPSLAENLHKDNELRPYSLSPLRSFRGKFLRTKSRGEIELTAGAKVKFRLGLLTTDIAEQILRINLQEEKLTITLAKGEFQIESIKMTKLAPERLLKESAHRSNKFQLSFLTPTYLAIKKCPFPMRFPDPRYLYSNLANIWNSTLGEKVKVDHDALREWVNENVSITGYNLKTRTQYISKGAMKIGFTGWVNYQLNPKNTDENNYAAWIHALSKFAEFSNVGGGRTAGFGCVQYYPKRQLETEPSADLTEEGPQASSDVNNRIFKNNLKITNLREERNGLFS